MEMHPIFASLDPLFIQLYRISGYSFIDFMVGTFLLAFVALIVGEFTISLAFLASRKYIDLTTDEVVRYHNLSVDAVAAGDKGTYEAANKLANDAFGRQFFMQIALSAAFLWPVFFVLAWMQQRFADVEFRVLFMDNTLGYFSIFVAMYAGSYLLFKRVKCRLPYFKRMKHILDAYDQRTRRMKSWSELTHQAENRT
jgi:hypothetical protein